ncbi:hypothetical protein PINS_up003961 [Pythium insidiosum]|nr:hypothetical protein PINS_up003961 [Pythium insidiosum]
MTIEAIELLETTPCLRQYADLDWIAYDAARYGRLDVIRYINNKDPQHLRYQGLDLRYTAISGAQLEVLSYLRDEIKLDFSTSVLYWATELSSHVEEVFNFILLQLGDAAREPDMLMDVFREAAREGRIELVGLLLDAARKFEIQLDTEDALQVASQSGVVDRSVKELLVNKLGLYPHLPVDIEAVH